MSMDDKNGHRAADALSAADQAALSKRASAIGNEIEAAKLRGVMPKHTDAAKSDAMSRGLKISAELIGGIVVGAGIGYVLDRWLGNEKPWFFILFFLLGSAAGILNIVRQAQREKTPPAPSVVDDDEDDK